MSGFDPGFLGAPLAAPRPSGDRVVRQLPYTHFEVLLDPERRLALSTAVNIDGARLLDLGRGDDWHLDERVPASEQTGPEVYARNDFDRGHLVRRRDPVWGEPAEARAGNVDSFCYTNAAPQASGFNQSKELWLGLEDLVLEYAQANLARIDVFTGPVLAEDDPVYRGVGIPLRFWKIAAWSPDGETLAASAYLLDQTALVRRIVDDGRLGGGTCHRRRGWRHSRLGCAHGRKGRRSLFIHQALHRLDAVLFEDPLHTADGVALAV